jgi:hypothetical protein
VRKEDQIWNADREISLLENQQLSLEHSCYVADRCMLHDMGIAEALDRLSDSATLQEIQLTIYRASSIAYKEIAEFTRAQHALKADELKACIEARNRLLEPEPEDKTP